MRAPALSVVIILLLYAQSCKKDGSFPLEPSTEYTKAGKTKIGNLRIFAQGGEIKTQTIITRFENYDGPMLNSMASQLYPNQAILDNFKVKSNGEIEVYDNLQKVTYTVKQSGNNLTLTGKDTLKFMSYGEVFTRTIPYYISSYKPLVFSETLVTSTRGFYGFEYTTQKQYHFELVDEGMDVPWITGAIHNGTGTIALLLQNKMDIDFHKNLAPTDTVVIQEYSVFYAK